MDIIQRTITPEEASDILASKNNINVRNIKKQIVRKYANAMMRGDWHYSWDCIAFDKEGNLLNGQHRLSACVVANEPIEFLVILNAENITGDTGIKRNVIESLRGQGKHLPEVFSSTTGVGLIRDIAKVYFGVKDADDDAILEYANYAAMDKCANVIKALSGGPAGIKKASVMSAIIGGYVITKDERCITFCEILCSGVSNEGSVGSVIALRDWLTNIRNTRAGRNDTTIADIRATVQGALRNYLNGNNVKRLVKRDELIYKPTEEKFQEEW